MISGAKKRAQSFSNKTDGTYNPMTGDIIDYSSGYQVSFVRPKTFERLGDGEYDKIVAEIMKTTGSIEHIGVWGGVAETSFWVESKKQAMGLAIRFNQDGIWNWASKMFERNYAQDTSLDD